MSFLVTSHKITTILLYSQIIYVKIFPVKQAGLLLGQGARGKGQEDSYAPVSLRLITPQFISSFFVSYSLSLSSLSSSFSLLFPLPNGRVGVGLLSTVNYQLSTVNCQLLSGTGPFLFLLVLCRESNPAELYERGLLNLNNLHAEGLVQICILSVVGSGSVVTICWRSTIGICVVHIG